MSDDYQRKTLMMSIDELCGRHSTEVSTCVLTHLLLLLHSAAVHFRET